MHDESLDLTGHFWRPQDEQAADEGEEGEPRVAQERWAGRLVEDPIRGVFVTASAPDRIDLFMETFAPIVWGRTVDQVVTMTDVQINVAGKLPGGSGSELTLRPWRTFVGRKGFESEDEIAFKRLVLRVEGLDEWGARSGFGRLWIPSLEDATVRYRQPASVYLGAIDGTRIELGFWVSASPRGDPTVRLELEQAAVLRFESDEPVPYSTLEPLAQHTRNFVIFAARQALDVLFVRGYVDPPDDEARYPDGYLEPITIASRYFPRRDPAETPPTRRQEFLFTAPAPGDATKLERWIELAHEDNLGPVIDLYLSTMYQPRAFAEYQFIALAHAAEILHTRRVRRQAYNISIRGLLLRLPARVRDLFPPPHEFARRAEASRTLHAHGDPQQKADAATTFDELAGLTQALRCLLEGLLLVEFGFTEAESTKSLRRTSTTGVSSSAACREPDSDGADGRAPAVLLRCPEGHPAHSRVPTPHDALSTQRLTRLCVLAHTDTATQPQERGSQQMPTEFKDLLREIEEEAVAEGPEAVAELEALRAHYQLARELLDLRQQRQLTQSRLSELSGVGQSEISRIESGRANPTLTTIAALAAPLGADLHLVSRD